MARKSKTRHINSSGYIDVEHREIVGKILGRSLKRSEVVHHIDKNKSNNDPLNLYLCNRAKHGKLHRKNAMPPKSNIYQVAIKEQKLNEFQAEFIWRLCEEVKASTTRRKIKDQDLKRLVVSKEILQEINYLKL